MRNAQQLLSYEAWQPEPTKNLVKSYPVKEGTKLYQMTSNEMCLICSSPKIPHMFDSNKNMPLVLQCTNCGRKSWAGSDLC